MVRLKNKNQPDDRFTSLKWQRNNEKYSRSPCDLKETKCKSDYFNTAILC